jgi:hypothetical protein
MLIIHLSYNFIVSQNPQKIFSFHQIYALFLQIITLYLWCLQLRTSFSLQDFKIFPLINLAIEKTFQIHHHYRPKYLLYPC